MWDDEDSASPKVSLPGGRSVTGSNRVEGEDEARSIGGPRTAGSTTNSNNHPATRKQSARSAAASTNAWSTSVPSARGDITEHDSQASAPGPPATAQSPPGLRLPTTTTSVRGTSSQRLAPGQSQSASNTRSTASAWTSSPSSTGPDADVAPAPLPRQGNRRQRDRGSESTGTSSSTLSDHQSTGRPGAITTSQSSSVSSEPCRAPTLPPGIFLPVDGGFPTFSDTTWGDPIAAAQSASTRKSTNSSSDGSVASRSAVGADVADGQASGDNGREAGQEKQDTTAQNDRTGRGRRGNRRGGRRGTAKRTAIAPAIAPSTSQDVAHTNVLDVTLPPGGPGGQWSSDNVEW